MDVTKIIRQIDIAFKGLPKPPSQCIERLSAKSAFIYDPVDGMREGVLVLAEPGTIPLDKLFAIRNRNETEFAIWRFDGCTDFREFEGALLEKACEAVIFNERSIAWIELKMEAKAETIRAANNVVSGACKQLWISASRVLDKLDQNNLPCPWEIYEAYIGTPQNFPRRQSSASLYASKLAEIGVYLFQINVLDLQ